MLCCGDVLLTIVVVVPTLVKMFKQVVNSSEGFDLEAVHNWLSQASILKKGKKKKQQNPSLLHQSKRNRFGKGTGTQSVLKPVGGLGWDHWNSLLGTFSFELRTKGPMSGQACPSRLR